ncbi:GIDE domain-containing protein [Haloarcula salinisoli]|uniref:RING-type E3 ubiquitin transferase n=1 Tax=Haloarcula salinisoli TaxID=2487746 RepID=A0A8J7YJS0_9EURY|nr:GIDE domain-containing protein [Halomicroarcula salinisoli]MBX0287101.1 hypothetical protein [Halomicroarcula salinisoli]MBX0304404.1 hypothetical protein [Halomicroarcula salinisoli]
MAELVPAAAMAAFALASGYATLTVYREQQAIAETATTTVDSLTPGQVKLEGRVDAESTVQSPITGAEGVVVDWEVKGEMDDDETDSDERLAGGQRTGEFRLTDGTGSVRIDPPYGAELTASDENTHVDRRHNPTLESLEAVDEGVRDGDDDRGDGTIMVSKAREYDEVTLRHEILQPNDDLTVVGTAQRTDDGMVVGGGDGSFVLSDMSEGELVAEFRKKLVLLGAATAVFLVGVVYFLAFA